MTKTKDCKECENFAKFSQDTKVIIFDFMESYFSRGGSFVRSFIRSFVRPFVLAFDRNGGARFGGARGRAGPHRFDQMQNFAFFSIFGGVLRTAAKNRKKCETKTFEVGLKLKFRSWRWFLSNFRQNRSYPRVLLTMSKFAKKFTWECLYLKCLHGYKIETVISPVYYPCKKSESDSSGGRPG